MFRLRSPRRGGWRGRQRAVLAPSSVVWPWFGHALHCAHRAREGGSVGDASRASRSLLVWPRLRFGCVAVWPRLRLGCVAVAAFWLRGCVAAGASRLCGCGCVRFGCVAVWLWGRGRGQDDQQGLERTGRIPGIASSSALVACVRLRPPAPSAPRPVSRSIAARPVSRSTDPSSPPRPVVARLTTSRASPDNRRAARGRAVRTSSPRPRPARPPSASS